MKRGSHQNICGRCGRSSTQWFQFSPYFFKPYVTVPARREASTLKSQRIFPTGVKQFTQTLREKPSSDLTSKWRIKYTLKKKKKNRNKAQQNAQKHTVCRRCGCELLRSAPLCCAVLCVSVYMCLCALQWRAPLLMILPGFFPPTWIRSSPHDLDHFHVQPTAACALFSERLE